mmetsp:Transcript_22692/g.48156  ORF Transcript_22692/g.48156 Transcript_22692/m.48156 type:complete len:247 (+) Transcript_22692:1245-1985(+)
MHSVGCRDVRPLLFQHIVEGEVQVRHGVFGVRGPGQKGNVRPRVHPDQPIRRRVDDRQGRQLVLVHQLQGPGQAFVGPDLHEPIVVGTDLQVVDRIVEEAPCFAKVCDQVLQDVCVRDARQHPHVFRHDNGQEIQSGFDVVPAAVTVAGCFGFVDYPVDGIRRVCRFVGIVGFVVVAAGGRMRQEQFARLFEAGGRIGRGEPKIEIHGLRNGRILNHVRDGPGGETPDVAIGAFEMSQYIDKIRHL